MKLESNFAVTAILARCLLEPQFQQRLSIDPHGALQNSGLSRDWSFTGFEFEKLELFGGLITQTQHNFLWESFPYSRALMKHYRIELRIFSSYRRRTGYRRPNLSKQEKIEEFTNYLRQFLLTDADSSSYPGLFEILTHERLQWELQETTVTQPRATKVLTPNIPSCGRELDRLIPAFPVHVRFESHRYDPLKIASALERKNFASRLKARRTALFYRMDPATNKLSVFQTASAACRLFEKVDGRRRVGSILRASTSNRPKRELRRYFESACLANLIDLRSS